jgi:hypothetical protein
VRQATAVAAVSEQPCSTWCQQHAVQGPRLLSVSVPAVIPFQGEAQCDCGRQSIMAATLPKRSCLGPAVLICAPTSAAMTLTPILRLMLPAARCGCCPGGHCLWGGGGHQQ